MLIRLDEHYEILHGSHGTLSLWKDGQEVCFVERPWWDEYGNDLFDSYEEAEESFIEDNTPKDLPEHVKKSWQEKLINKLTSIRFVWDDIKNQQ